MNDRFESQIRMRRVTDMGAERSFAPAFADSSAPVDGRTSSRYFSVRIHWVGRARFVMLPLQSKDSEWIERLAHLASYHGGSASDRRGSRGISAEPAFSCAPMRKQLASMSGRNPRSSAHMLFVDARSALKRASQSLIEIGNEVIDVLQADR